MRQSKSRMILAGLAALAIGAGAGFAFLRVFTATAVPAAAPARIEPAPLRAMEPSAPAGGEADRGAAPSRTIDAPPVAGSKAAPAPKKSKAPFLRRDGSSTARVPLPNAEELRQTLEKLPDRFSIGGIHVRL